MKLRSFIEPLVAGIRADRPLYIFIAAYILLSFVFVRGTGASERVTYDIYFEGRYLYFLYFMPIIAIAVDLFLVVHRFERRRLLVLRRTFSLRRVLRMALGLLLLMGVMLFLGTFTSVKSALSVGRDGFPYDRMLADADAFVHFGVDPWRLMHPLLENDSVRGVVEWNYGVMWFILWFAILFFVVTSTKSKNIRVRYVTCFMLTWIVCGNLLAGLFLSAGPAFYGEITGEVSRFAEQLSFLARSSDLPYSAVGYQSYLWRLYEMGETGLGSGISAFPSVHVAVVALNTFFAWEHSRCLGMAMLCYLLFMIASSVYLAWHYAIDGYASVAIVAVIYYLTRRFMIGQPRALPGLLSREIFHVTPVLAKEDS